MGESFDKKAFKITPSSYQEARKLERILAKVLADSSIDIKDTSDSPEMFMGELIKSVLHLLISEELEEALFVCSKKAAYNSEKITVEFFDKPENRELYYPIMIEVMKVNVLPFIKGLSSQFKALTGTDVESLLKRK